MWLRISIVVAAILLFGMLQTKAQENFEVLNKAYVSAGVTLYEGATSDETPILANIEFSDYISFQKGRYDEIYERFGLGLLIGYDIKVQDTPYSIFTLQPALNFNLLRTKITIDLLMGSGVSYLYSDDGTHPAVGSHAGFRVSYGNIGLEAKLKTFSSTQGVFDLGSFGISYKF